MEEVGHAVHGVVLLRVLPDAAEDLGVVRILQLGAELQGRGPVVAREEAQVVEKGKILVVGVACDLQRGREQVHQMARKLAFVRGRHLQGYPALIVPPFVRPGVQPGLFAQQALDDQLQVRLGLHADDRQPMQRRVPVDVGQRRVGPVLQQEQGGGLLTQISGVVQRRVKPLPCSVGRLHHAEGVHVRRLVGRVPHQRAEGRLAAEACREVDGL
mmetsp:Transcript_76830/g.235138  ORF Transcript_76830/g.235138 Transcript_76830/m.235138 type:complete len:214 (+) Transcript_76830:2065-2706(+)